MTKTTRNTDGESSPTPTQRITPRALLELKRLSDPQIHPDAQRIAFTVHEADFDESRWVSHIWITEYLPPDAPLDEEADDFNESDAAVGIAEDPEPAADNSENDPEQSGNDEPPSPDELTRQLTFSTEGESDPLWSPDGRYLAFMSARLDTTVPPQDDDEDEAPVAQIWALPMDGGEARRLTNTKEAILDFCWTPDGEGLIFLALEPRPRPIESVRRDRQRRKFDPIVEHDEPRRRQFWQVTVAEHKPRLLFTADYGVEAFAVSPDGERVAYLTNYTGEENDYHVADLYLHDLESHIAVKLVHRDGGKYRLRWSPSGSQIAFLAWHDPQLSYSRESVYTVEVPSREAAAEFAAQSPATATISSEAAEPAAIHDIRSAQARIEAPAIAECRAVTDLDHDIHSFEWLEDPSAILALAAVRTSTQLYTLAPNHSLTLSSPHPLTATNADRRDLAVHRESGRAVWIEEGAASPPEIVLREADGVEHVLTRLNADFAETYRAPRQELVTWRAPDGLEIEGVMTYPIDYQPGTRVPLIVQVHGGPKGRATNTLLDYPMPAVWASEGYLVLRPNYRGSEGYGHAFAVSNRRDLGGGDFSDIMAGVDWAVGEGMADPERVGILGGSYGGYMVNWAIGHTDRFKAAISMFGIFHLETDYSNSRLSRWEYDYLGAYYWEDPETYRKLSPATYLENIRTPTLIVHGDEDDNTALSNSRELYRALLQRGVPAQFVHYPREGHGIQEPNHRLDDLRRSLAWMDRYVRRGETRPVYRVGDRVPHSGGHLELRVISAETATFLGRHAPKDAKSPSSMLEVVFTIHNLDPLRSIEPLTLRLTDVTLSVGAAPALHPVGVPLDLPGGKVLVQGENLTIAQHPDPETGELAFAAAAVFEVPKSGEARLQAADFDFVAVNWIDESEETNGED